MPPPPPPLDPKLGSTALLVVAFGCGGATDTNDTDRTGSSRDQQNTANGQHSSEADSTQSDDATTMTDEVDDAPDESSATKPGSATSDVDTPGSASASGTSEVISEGDPNAGSGTAPTATSLPTNDGAMETVDVLRSCVIAEIGEDSPSKELMAPFAIRHTEFARRTIYSWTTAEQVDELRADPTLLTRSTTSEGERGRAADLMALHAETDPIAALLERPEYANRRFGWSNPWATLMGWEGETYGNHLLEITLREEAWVGRLIATRDGLEWSFADSQGNEVSSQQVLDTPERLAAVYFADTRDHGGCGTLYVAGANFREYFLVNEGMIERWEAYTPQVRAELERSIVAIEALLNELREAECELYPGCPIRDLIEYWRGDTDLNSTGMLYMASLAFQNSQYQPYAENLEQLLQQLNDVPFDAEPLEHDYPALEQ